MTANPRARLRWLVAVLSAAVLLHVPSHSGALNVGLPTSLAESVDDPQAADQALAAAPPSVYWGALVPGWPADTAALDGFEREAGKGMSIVGWSAPWWRTTGYVPFQTAYFDAVRKRGSIPMLSWSSWDYCCALDQPKFQLSSITRGEHDAFLTAWARSAHAWGHPFFLNMDSEMNGWWWPWSEEANGNGPGDFVPAWRHVVDLFRREGATNVTWVWCPNILEAGSTPLDQVYPGDTYVDWTCMDGYNWGTAKNNRWQDFGQVFGGSDYNGGNTYDALTQLVPTKPIMIAETGSTEDGGSKADWITDAFTRSLPRDFPSVRGVVWYARRDDDPEVKWGIDTTPEAQAAFAAAIGLPRYASNVYGSFEGSPIQPPDGPFASS